VGRRLEGKQQNPDCARASHKQTIRGQSYIQSRTKLQFPQLSGDQAGREIWGKQIRPTRSLGDPLMWIRSRSRP
jgi:hypothetical protein